MKKCRMGVSPLVRVRLDKSGRRGKTVTVVENIPLRPDGKRALLQEIQRLCGAGGTLKGGLLEIQGDHRLRVATRLESLGHRVIVA